MEVIMQFTARQIKSVERLRKRERQWRWHRWILLGTGIFAWACYGYIVFDLIQQLQSSADANDDFMSRMWLFGFAMMWPKCLLGFVVGACLIGVAIRDWHGNVNRMLLLKLLDAQQQESERGVQAV
jgi:hypothetical protein